MTIPRTRGDCENGERPCPHTGCRHHLADRRGRLHGAESCALDVAEQGGITLEAAGDLMGCTRERIRQIEERALVAMRKRLDALEMPPKERKRLRMVHVDATLERSKGEAPTAPQRWRALTEEQATRTRERSAKRRAEETPEEREKRLEYLRDYHRTLRAKQRRKVLRCTEEGEAAE